MVASIEVQVISYIIESKDKPAVTTLLEYDSSYFMVFNKGWEFIRKHYEQTGKAPDRATFSFQFPDFVYVEVNEPLSWLISELKRNKKHKRLIEVINTVKELGADDVEDGWTLLEVECEKNHELDNSRPMDIVHDTEERKNKVLEYSKQMRIPTGFAEIDKAMYGGLSTVEELVLLEARLGSGKSWICTEITESAQKHGFNVAYYSPEMQSSYIGTRFDTWRGHFANSQLFQGQYSDEYLKHLDALKEEKASVFVIEDKDAPDNSVTVPFLRSFVRSHNVKLLIIDGLSYMTDTRGTSKDRDDVRYKHICEDLFRLSKSCGCAVLVVVQANRATKDTKDEKGEPFPNAYNIEGSDHPARIATQIFAVRQIFEKHILDIRLEKARNAQNQKPVFSYSWDINTGVLHYIPNNEDTPTVSTPVINSGFVVPDISGVASNTVSDIELDIDDDVEF